MNLIIKSLPCIAIIPLTKNHRHFRLLSSRYCLVLSTRRSYDSYFSDFPIRVFTAHQRIPELQKNDPFPLPGPPSHISQPRQQRNLDPSSQHRNVSEHNSDFFKSYLSKVKSGEIQSDPNQYDAVLTLEKVFTQIQDLKLLSQHETATQSSSWLNKITAIFSSSPSQSQGVKWGLTSPPGYVKGAYLYGGVGCGKTMLMDILHESITSHVKRREHFHEFMLDFHARLYEIKVQNSKLEKSQRQDPFHVISEQMISSFQVLCLDEFQVTDIADAVVLSRLFSSLFKRGMVLIATSNRPPSDLYKNGLQRKELFEPFIPVLEERVFVYKMKSPKDYRLVGHRVDDVYLTISSTEQTHSSSKQAIAERIQYIFKNLVNQKTVGRRSVKVGARTLKVGTATDNIALFHFNQLCDQPLSAADYVALCRNFHTIVIEEIPKMKLISERNIARRFITLVDELYEHRIKLVCSAYASPDELFDAEQTEKSGASDEVFAADRTVSRLLEMQSQEYLTSHWRDVEVEDLPKD